MTSRTPRDALIKKINIARRALKLPDEHYRARLVRVTGLDSLRAMDVAQMDAVFADLVSLGYEEPVRYRRRHEAPKRLRTIYGLWLELGNLGFLKDPSKRALYAFTKRQTGVDRPEWLRSSTEASKLITALQQMVKRAREAKDVPASSTDTKKEVS